MKLTCAESTSPADKVRKVEPLTLSFGDFAARCRNGLGESGLLLFATFEFQIINRSLSSVYVCEKRDHRVILRLRNRVQLMIVTTSAVNRDTAEARHHLSQHIIQIVSAALTTEYFVLRFLLSHEVIRASR